MNDQIPPRNRAERRAAMRGKGRRAAGAALTAGSAALAMTAAVLGTSAPAGAATTRTVTDPGNAGAGTLRDALANANDGDTIVFAPGITNVSVTARLLVEDAVTIQGAGVVTVAGNGTDSVFYLDAPGNANITISGLTITGGHGTGTSSRDGGGIANTDEHLTLDNSVVTGNTSVNWGAGIEASGPGNSLTLVNSAVTGNTADDGGGGIKLDESTGLDITASSVSGNTAKGGNDSGGGLYLSTINGNVNITGSAIDNNTVQGLGGGGLYASDIEGALTITNSSMSGNTVVEQGGGLYSDYVSGPINISGSRFDNNTTSDGGGGGVYLSESHGGVTITNSSISGNTSGSSGGGLYVDYFYQGFTIQSTTISGNTAASAGGGVYHSEGGQGSFVVLDSTISGNTAQDGWGGGLYTNGSDSPLKIQNSTISGNTASDEGGAMWFGGYYGLELTQSTITGNTATNIGGIALYGVGEAAAADGGHRAKTKDVRTKDKSDKEDASTKGNDKVRARKANGGRVHAQADGDVAATGTILAKNVGQDIGTNGNPTATLTSDHSLLGVIGDGVTVSDAGGTLTGVDPLLGPLQNNGGPTETHELLAGSPAINAGPNPVPSFPTNEFDQRGEGFARVVDGVVDIGAFEVQPPPTPEPVVITPKFTG